MRDGLETFGYLLVLGALLVSIAAAAIWGPKREDETDAFEGTEMQKEVKR
jgi:hypothetical protein